MRKKYLIILIILLIAISILTIIINNTRVIIYMNWEIYLPKPEKINIVYNFDFREGEYLEIWHYRKESQNKIINNKKFKSINESDKDFIIKKINEYYEILDNDEKILFSDNVPLNTLLEGENYFAYINKKNDEKSWLLLLLDCKNNKLYYFSNIS